MYSIYNRGGYMRKIILVCLGICILVGCSDKNVSVVEDKELEKELAPVL